VTSTVACAMFPVGRRSNTLLRKMKRRTSMHSRKGEDKIFISTPAAGYEALDQLGGNRFTLNTGMHPSDKINP